MSFADDLVAALPIVRPYAHRLAGQDGEDLL
jgi:hypothetical protein